MLDQLGVSADEAVMIDDLEWLNQGAKEVGMKTIVFKDLSQLKTELKNAGIT